jgi:hypothetical protein
MRSIVLGTAGLWLVLGVAVIVSTRARPDAANRAAQRTLRLRVLLCTCVQAAHFLEEWQTGFHQHWPALLGLEPWPESFFVVFNVAWIAIWLASAALIPRGGIVTRTAVWFLALAALLNAVAHPLLAMSVAGYFPGLWTSPFLGAAGFWLWLALRRAHGTQAQSG